MAQPEVGTETVPRQDGTELVQALCDLLDRTDLVSGGLGRDLEALACIHGDAVYSQLLHLLSHLHFDDQEARRHWQRIVGLQKKMSAALGTHVDLRVALVSYFVEVNRKLKNPKIIEMKLFERTQSFAYRDELTGLHNYRLFRDYLDQEIQRSNRCGAPLSVVMIDVDRFKVYNDRYGHQAGNRVLSEIGVLLQQSVRKGDLPARYGGEEFAVILPMTPKTEAYDVAERIRVAIEEHAFSVGGRQRGRVTASLGVATYPADAGEMAEVIRQADRALYVAKAAGRNQVELCGQCRRSFSRIPSCVKGAYRILARDVRSLETLNVSEQGMLVRIDRYLVAGSLIDFTLDLPGQRRIEACGRVVHTEDFEDGSYQAAVRITSIDPADLRELGRYIATTAAETTAAPRA